MNKLVTFFLITAFLCANTSIGEFLKVPNLIEHYKDHKLEALNTTSSFIDFIKEHYSKNTENTQKEHENLPFKTLDNNPSSLFVFTVSNFLCAVKKVNFVTHKVFFYKKTFKSNLFTSIWLPPKIV